jgi:hypothetical protein
VLRFKEHLRSAESSPDGYPLTNGFIRSGDAVSGPINAGSLAVAAHNQADAVKFDFVDPFSPAGRCRPNRREARSNEAHRKQYRPTRSTPLHTGDVPHVLLLLQWTYRRKAEGWKRWLCQHGCVTPPTLPTTPRPVAGPSAPPHPASRAGSRICEADASLEPASGRGPPLGASSPPRRCS